MKLPPLNALRVFEAAARKGSFVAAGEELGVTSAAVSLQVRKLEDWLGRALFFRHNNQIRLTDAGEDLYRNAAKTLLEIANYARSVQHIAKTRPLTLSAVPSVAERWLPTVARAWKNRHPLRLVAHDDPLDLERAEVDIHISYGTNGYSDFVQTPLMQDTVTPMCAPNHPALHTPPETWPLIVTDWGRNFTRAPKWSAWYEENDQLLPQTPPLSAASSSIALSLAEQGLGVVLGQNHLARTALSQGRLIRLTPCETPLQSTYFAISPHHRQSSSLIRSLLKILKEIATHAQKA